MGKGKKLQPVMLPAKLRAVRRFLNFTQEQMTRYVVPQTKDAASDRAALSDYESGRRAPSPLEVFYYAKAVCDLTVFKNFTSDDLIDDARELPFSAESENIAAVIEINTEINKEPAIVSEPDKVKGFGAGVSVENAPNISSAREENSDADLARKSPAQLIVGKQNYEDEIDYPRSFYFSYEFLENFDDFMMRLLLAAPYRFREHYCDSSLSIEVAVTAALRDLERMERENAPSVVVECLHEHIANHYEN